MVAAAEGILHSGSCGLWHVHCRHTSSSSGGVIIVGMDAAKEHEPNNKEAGECGLLVRMGGSGACGWRKTQRNNIHKDLFLMFNLYLSSGLVLGESFSRVLTVAFYSRMKRAEGLLWIFRDDEFYRGKLVECLVGWPTLI